MTTALLATLALLGVPQDDPETARLLQRRVQAETEQTVRRINVMLRALSYHRLDTAEENRALEDVGIVVCTHFHFDHAGGLTRLAEDGRAVPVFPRARHLVQRTELHDAQHPTVRSAASYFPWNWDRGDGCIVRLVAITDPGGKYRIERGREF